MHLRIAILINVVLASALSCADVKELLLLQQGLSHEFQSPDIRVNVHNSTSLTVIFSNSPHAQLPEGQRSAFARRVAEYARDHFPRYDQLQTIHVGFATVKGAGGVQMTTTDVPYQFSRDELGQPQRSIDADTAKAAA